VVWDALHHCCLDPDGIPPQEALALPLDTWRNGLVPKIHCSSPRTAVEERRRKAGRRVERQIVLPPLRAHAGLIDPIGFERARAAAAPCGGFGLSYFSAARISPAARSPDSTAPLR